jgi:hypothetical protein
LVVAGLFKGGFEDAAVSEELQALEPHTSELDQFADAIVPAGFKEAAGEVLVGGGDLVWAADKLKTDPVFVDEAVLVGCDEG